MPRGRKGSKGAKTTRKSRPSVNLVDLGFGLVAANAVTTGLFDTGLRTFLFEGWFGKGKSKASDNSWEITLGELLTQPTMGMAPNWQEAGLGAVIQRNLKRNGMMAAGTLLVLPFASKAIKRGIAPLTRPTNRMLKAAKITAVKV